MSCIIIISISLHCTAAGERRDLCSAQQRSYALIASNLATLYTQRDIINRKIFPEDSHS